MANSKSINEANINAINKVLCAYFDFLYYCDLEKFNTIFHEQAIYATSDELPALFRNMNEYKQVITKREPPANKNEPRQDIIDSIELAGENTARAKVRCSIGSNDYVDFLTLIRVDKKWLIIAKVFQIIKRNE